MTLMRLPHLAAGSKRALFMLVVALWTQMFIGVNVIWNNVPINLASLHQVGAVTVLSLFLLTSHCGRKVDPRHVANLIGKLRIEDYAAYRKLMVEMGKR